MSMQFSTNARQGLAILDSLIRDVGDYVILTDENFEQRILSTADYSDAIREIWFMRKLIDLVS